MKTTEIVQKVAELHCPASNGFEGPDTFGACGQDDCVVCYCKKLVASDQLPQEKAVVRPGGTIPCGDKWTFNVIIGGRAHVPASHIYDSPATAKTKMRLWVQYLNGEE